jgi:hypothetical protein
MHLCAPKQSLQASLTNIPITRKALAEIHFYEKSVQIYTNTMVENVITAQA